MQDLPNQNNRKYVTISKASQILGVSIDTVRRWEKQGKISSKRLDGKNRYFSASELYEYLANKPLSISEAAARLGVSTSTLRRYEKKGLIVPERNGNGERLYSLKNVDDFLNRSKAKEFNKDLFSKGWNILGEKAVSVARASVIALAVLVVLFASGVKKDRVSQEGQVLGIADSAWGILAEVQMFISDLFNFTQQPAQQTFEVADLGKEETRVIERIVTERIVSEVSVVEDGVVTNAKLADDAVTGIKILNDTIRNEDIADGAINSAKIEDNTITSSDIKLGSIVAEDLADNIISASILNSELVFENGDLVDLSAVNHGTTSKQGLILPNVSNSTPTSPSSEEGYIAWDTSGNQVVVFDGTAWTEIGGSVTLASEGGLEYVSDELSLSQSCGNGQVMKWNGSSWACGNDSGGGGGGIVAVERNNTNQVNSAASIDFSTDFTVTLDTGEGENEADIGINYSTSGITRNDQDETVTGAWNFSTGTTTIATADINGGSIDGTTVGSTTPAAGSFTTLTTTGTVDLSSDTGADTIIIGQSGTTDDTVTIAGDVSITDDQWSISATGVTSGLSGITADSVAFSGVSGGTNTNALVIGTGEVYRLPAAEQLQQQIFPALTASAQLKFQTSRWEQIQPGIM